MKSITIAELSAEINKNANEKGFWEPNYNIGEKLMLIVSEVSEALEADRKGRRCEFDPDGLIDIASDDVFVREFQKDVKDTFEDEIADAIIRLLDLAYQLDIPIEQHIAAKMRFNSTRPYKHGKKY